MQFEINLPDILSEVTDNFFRYERAIIENNIELLNSYFWESSLTRRFGAEKNQYGFDEIAAFRNARPTTNLARELRNTQITTFGSDFAVANTEFYRSTMSGPGRQSQTWLRTENGWKIVSAHVSVMLSI